MWSLWIPVRAMAFRHLNGADIMKRTTSETAASLSLARCCLSHLHGTEYVLMTRQVFSVLFSEAAGSTATPYNDSFSRVKYGEYVHSQIRRFIVVGTRHGFCYAV